MGKVGGTLMAAAALVGGVALFTEATPVKRYGPLEGVEESAAPVTAMVNPVAPTASATTPSAYAAGECTATDGDSVRCGDERFRLVEIDAPEMPGHCRKGRVCAPGDPYAARAELRKIIAAGFVVERYGLDPYKRTLADLQVNEGVSVSCLMIASGTVKRELKWEDYGVTEAC